MRKHFLLWVGITLVTIFILSVAWEFLFEDWLRQIVFPISDSKKSGKRWEFVFTSFSFAVLALIIPTVLALRKIEDTELAYAKLEKTESLTQNILNNAYDAIVSIDESSQVIGWNKRAEIMFGWSGDEAQGKKITDLIIPDDLQKEHSRGLARFLTTKEANILNREIELVARHKEGHPIPIELTVSPAPWGKSFIFTGIIRDISHRKEIEAALKSKHEELVEANLTLQKISTHDGLTGIANRRYFDEYLEKEWKRSARDKAFFSLIMLDIDFFKLFNDTYGHQAGDDCLKKVAKALEDQLNRPADLAARYGGEEFAVILPETNEEGASKMAETLRKSIEQLKIEHKESKLNDFLTVSLGVASIVPAPNSSAEWIIALADKALYQAKSEGRNQVKVCAG